MPRTQTVSQMQGRYWMLTIPHHGFTPYLPDGTLYIKGQLEQGDSGYLHWQLMVVTPKCRGNKIKSIFGDYHIELTRSTAASDYVWKEETRVAGTQFELGQLPLSRARSHDWERIRELAIQNNLAEIPADVYVRNYNALRRIATDNLQPVAMERACSVFWGRTGTGKSRRAWEEAGLDAYPKNPRSKFWDGYKSHKHVVMDEFRGGIDIAYLLIWLDRYPVIVEIKGSSVVLRATHIWITSNLDPRLWYPDADEETKEALLRRLNIHHFHYFIKLDH